MSFSIDSIDHIVLNVADVEASAEWYVRILGMQRIDFDSRTGVRVAVHFGAHKINLRPNDAEMVSGARVPMTSVYCRDPDGNLIEVATYP